NQGDLMYQFFKFILLSKSVKNKFLFSMTAYEWWVNCLFRGRMTDLYLVNLPVWYDGATVYAPFDVKLSGKVTVYTNPKKAAINDGINLSGEGLCFKLFYVKPDSYSGVVKKGHNGAHRGITSHVYVKMTDPSIDPTLKGVFLTIH
uniref:Uncharacterized protein n=1 Tax=Oncorhynchus tshawytscha TaxID=74940 RepID=A0A8C8MKH5_ONCTS